MTDLPALKAKAEAASKGEWTDVVLELIAEIERLRKIANRPHERTAMHAIEEIECDDKLTLGQTADVLKRIRAACEEGISACRAHSSLADKVSDSTNQK